MVLQEKSGMVHYLKMWNMRNIMLLLLSRGEMTKQDLLEQTRLSASTVSDCVGKLLALGVVTDAGREESSGGRRAAIYRVTPSFGMFMGITLLDDAISFVLCDMQGKTLLSWTEPLDGEGPVLHALYLGIERGIAAGKGGVLALGLGFTGKTSTEKGIVLENRRLLWNNVHIKEILERRYGVYAYVDHPVNCGALEQQVYGRGQHMMNFMCFYPQFPQKAAVVLEGRVIHGEENACGTLAGPPEDLSKLKELAGFLSVDRIFIGSTHETAQQPADPFFSRFVTPALYFERCTALMAQLQWFEKIYDLVNGGPE